jgi:uridine monophosphate synthetase
MSKNEHWTNTSHKLVMQLVKIGAIKFGEFSLRLHEKYPNAPLSPFYIDLGVISAYVHDIRTATNLMTQVMCENNLHPALLCGIPNRADSLTALISHYAYLDRVILRKNNQGHGFSNELQGKFELGQQVLVIDDVVSGADSKLDAIRVLEAHGLIIQAVLVLVDREQGGRLRLEQEGYFVYSVFQIKQLLEFYHSEGLINFECLKRCLDYLQDPLGQHAS